MRLSRQDFNIRYCRTFRHPFVNDVGGAIAVEFAFLGPLLFYLMLNIFVGAIYLGAFHKLQHVTAQAARASIAGIDAGERLSLVRQSLDRALGDGVLLRPASISVSVDSLSADRAHYRVSLSYDTRALGLGRIPGVATFVPETLTSSFDVRNGGL